MNAICVLIYWHLGCSESLRYQMSRRRVKFEDLFNITRCHNSKKMLAIFCSFYSWQIIVHRNLLVLGTHNLKHFSTVFNGFGKSPCYYWVRHSCHKQVEPNVFPCVSKLSYLYSFQTKAEFLRVQYFPPTTCNDAMIIYQSCWLYHKAGYVLPMVVVTACISK